MRTLVLTLLVVFLAAGCGTTVTLDSSAPSEPVTMDAELTEWGGKLYQVDGGNMAVGVQNDGDYLYVSLSTRNPSNINQIMQHGLILWIDPAGGKEETFGVRHPIGIMETGGTGGFSSDPDANRVMIEQSLQELELIDESGRGFRRHKDAVAGMALHAEAGQRVFTYEAKVPLRAGEGIAYAIGTEPGRQIGVGFATPEIEGQNMMQHSGTGGLPGGRMSSADGRGRYSMTGLPTTNIPPPIREWILVTLVDAQ